jgi:Pentapeptide repeats (9 copies)
VIGFASAEAKQWMGQLMRFSVFWCLCLSFFLIHSAHAGKPGRKKINPKLTPSFFPYSSPCKGRLNTRGFSVCSDFTPLDFTKKKYHHPIETFRRALVGSSFEGRNLSGVHFNSTDLRYVNFREAKLHNAIFEATDLRYADLRGADLSAVTFMNSSVDGNKLQLNGALFDEHTIFPGNNFDEVADPSLLISITSGHDAIRQGMVFFSIDSSNEEVEYIVEGLTPHSVTQEDEAEYQILTLKDPNDHRYQYKISSEKIFARVKQRFFKSDSASSTSSKIRIEVAPGDQSKEMDILLDARIIEDLS